MASVRPADPQYEDQLLPARSARRSPIIIDSDEEGDRDDDPAPPAPAHAADAAFPLIHHDRVVGGEEAYGSVHCTGNGSNCVEHLGTKFVNMGCRHVLCFECYAKMRAIQGPAARITCVVCKSVDTIIEDEPASNMFILGLVFRLKVRCPYAPEGCPATYEIGHNFHGELAHLKSCGHAPATCPDCKLAMTVQQMRDHPALCPDRVAPCKCCHELVKASELEAHVGEHGPRGCSAMVPCPLGCVAEESLSVIKHAPHPKRARAEFAAQRREHATMIPRGEVEAHKRVCPCRIEACPFPGCTHELVAHEVKSHTGKRKFAEEHLMCLLRVRATEQAERRAERAALEQRIDQLAHHNRGNPFEAPGYTQLFGSVFRLRAKGFMGHAPFVWPTPRKRSDPPTNTLKVTGVEDIKRLIFTVSDEPEEPRLLKKLSVEVRVEPIEGAVPVPRQLGLSIRICRPTKPGDRNSVSGVCVDAGVHCARMVTDFAISGDLARHELDAFPYEILHRAAVDDDYLSPGHPPDILLYVELFERFA